MHHSVYLNNPFNIMHIINIRILCVYITHNFILKLKYTKWDTTQHNIIIYALYYALKFCKKKKKMFM